MCALEHQNSTQSEPSHLFQSPLLEKKVKGLLCISLICTLLFLIFITIYKILRRLLNDQLIYLEDIRMATCEQQMAANIVIGVSSTISMCATVGVFIKFACNPQLWNFEYTLIIALCMADFIQASSIGMPVIYYWASDQLPLTINNYTNTLSCKTQGFFQLLGCLGQFVWTFNIGYSIYRGLFPETFFQAQKRKQTLICFGISLPLIFCIFPLAWNTYGQSSFSETVCSISTSTLAGKIQVDLLFGIPMIVSLSFSCYFFLKVAFCVQAALGNSITHVARLMIYPLILFFGQGWFCIYYLASTIWDVGWIDYQILCYAASNLMGFFDSIFYFYYSVDQGTESTQTSNIYSLLSQPLSLQASDAIDAKSTSKNGIEL